VGMASAAVTGSEVDVGGPGAGLAAVGGEVDERSAQPLVATVREGDVVSFTLARVEGPPELASPSCRTCLPFTLLPPLLAPVGSAPEVRDVQPVAH
jgi:hypothetical protein